MNVKSTLVLAAFAAAATATFAFGSSAQAGERSAMTYCAGGYHADARGDCQPDGGTPSVCPEGTHYMPFPNGDNFRCQLDGH